LLEKFILDSSDAKIRLNIGTQFALVKTKMDDPIITTNGFGFQAGFSIYLL